MNTITTTFNGNTTSYKIINGTAYHLQTNNSVCQALEAAKTNRTRIRVYYGDIATGKCWNEEYGVTGYVGRSTGSIKIPLLIYNNNSHGGGAILDHCIIKIKESKGNRVIFQADNFKQPVIEIVESDMVEYSHNLMVDGELYARLTSLKKAEALKVKLS